MRRILPPQLAATAGLALVLAGCNQSPGAGTTAADANAALPALPQAVALQPGAATPIAPAPAVSALPAAPRLRLARVADPRQSYAYLDRANGVFDAIGDAPPDYAFDGGGVSPWAWQTSGGDVEYAEPIDGGYRYYYYEPGADRPYLVRDPDYSYGYSDGQLVSVYGANGGLVPEQAWRGRADDASRYYARAAFLAGLARQRDHRGVVAANWAARRADVDAARAHWDADRAQQADWAAYHQAHAGEEQAHWAGEQQRRAIAAQQFAGWQRQDFQGAPPASGGGGNDTGGMPHGFGGHASPPPEPMGQPAAPPHYPPQAPRGAPGQTHGPGQPADGTAIGHGWQHPAPSGGPYRPVSPPASAAAVTTAGMTHRPVDPYAAPHAGFAAPPATGYGHPHGNPAQVGWRAGQPVAAHSGWGHAPVAPGHAPPAQATSVRYAPRLPVAAAPMHAPQHIPQPGAAMHAAPVHPAPGYRPLHMQPVHAVPATMAAPHMAAHMPPAHMAAAHVPMPHMAAPHGPIPHMAAPHMPMPHAVPHQPGGEPHHG